MAKGVRLDELIGTALREPVSLLLVSEPEARRGADVEGVHQFRVATRRLRSHLRTFASFMERDATNRLRVELTWLADVVGPVRDADVLRAKLEDRVAALPSPDKRTGHLIIASMEANAQAQRVAMLRALDSDRYAALRSLLTQLVEQPPLVEGAPAHLSKRRATRLVRKRWRAVARAAEATLDTHEADLGPSRAVDRVPGDTGVPNATEATTPASDAALHRVRILAKRARYTADSLQLAIGPDAARFSRAMERVQDLLGDHHDTVVMEARLRAIAASDPAVALVAGELIAAETASRCDLAARWPTVWRATTTRKICGWLD